MTLPIETSYGVQPGIQFHVQLIEGCSECQSVIISRTEEEVEFLSRDALWVEKGREDLLSPITQCQSFLLDDQCFLPSIG
jgi:hypothetical protein